MGGQEDRKEFSNGVFLPLIETRRRETSSPRVQEPAAAPAFSDKRPWGRMEAPGKNDKRREASTFMMRASASDRSRLDSRRKLVQRMKPDIDYDQLQEERHLRDLAAQQRTGRHIWAGIWDIDRGVSLISRRLAEDVFERRDVRILLAITWILFITIAAIIIVWFGFLR